jgi:(p)ppGpp synthase/HD superfamily hydrolase
MSLSLHEFEKSRIALREWARGKEWFDVVRAMHEGEILHSGKRKDGYTPEFAHQIWIANHLRTLRLNDEDRRVVIIAAFFHDSSEDKNVPNSEIVLKYGQNVGDIVDRMTKTFRGVDVPTATYFSRLAEQGLAILLKGVDRLHNLSTMHGVFDRHKQENYIAESLEWHLPMIRLGRNRFPEYEDAYQNVKQSLMSRISLIRAIHAAEDHKPA